MNKHGWKWLIPAMILMITVLLAGCAAADPAQGQTRSQLENGDSEWTLYLGLPEATNISSNYTGACSEHGSIQLRVWEDLWDANSTAIPYWSIHNYNQEIGAAGPKYNFSFEEETWNKRRGVALVPKDFTIPDATTTGTNTYEVTCVYKGANYKTTETVHFVKKTAYPTDVNLTVASWNWNNKCARGAAETIAGGELTFVKGQDYVLTMAYADNDPDTTVDHYLNWWAGSTNGTSSPSLTNAVYVPSRNDMYFSEGNGANAIQNHQLIFRALETGDYQLGLSLSLGMSNLKAQKVYTLHIVEPAPANWNWEYEPDEQTLIISGTGMVTLGENETAPWLGEYTNPVIKRIVINEGITGIGANVFAGISGKVRVDFLQESLVPAVDANAFGSDMTAVCRYYYYTNGSWPASYIEMPHFYKHGALTYGPVSYKKGTNSGWSVQVLEENGIEKPLSPEAAHEVLIDSRQMYVYGMPSANVSGEEPAFATVIENVEAENWTLTVPNGADSAVELSLANAEYDGMPDNFHVCENMPSGIYAEGNGTTLTVNDSRNSGIGKLHVSQGTVYYYGKIQKLELEGTSDGSSGNVTVLGDIDNLHYYGETDQYSSVLNGPYARCYIGTLRVLGQITKGTVFSANAVLQQDGTTIMTMPVGPAWEFGPLTFVTAGQPAYVINTNDPPVLKVNSKNLRAFSADISQYTLRYVFSYNPYENEGVGGLGRTLQLTPKTDAGLGNAMIQIDLGSSFSESGIVWGSDTTVALINMTGSQPIVLNGDSSGEQKTGLGTIEISGPYTAMVNCPVGHIGIQPEPAARGDINLTITDQVNSLYIQQNNCSLTVTAGAGGRIGGGTYRPPLRDVREFGTIVGSSEGTPVISGNALGVMSWKNSGGVKSILPTDATVTAALPNTNEYTGKQAMIDLKDKDPVLTEAEKSAIAAGLNIPAEKIDGRIDKVFDLGVTTYTTDATDGFQKGSAVSELEDPVTVQIEDNGGNETVVARLHEGEDGLEATVLANTATAGRIYQFATDKFSTYVLLKGEKGLTFRNAEGTIINGTTQTGRYFYKVYIELPEGTEAFQIGYGDPEKNEPDEQWWRGPEGMPSDEYGTYFYAMPPEKGNDALFARANEKDPWIKIVFEYDRDKMTENNNPDQQPITNTIAPELQEPYTVNWTTVTDTSNQPAEAYIINWANPGLGYFEASMVYDGTKTSFTLDEKNSEDFMMALGMPGVYEISLTALMAGGSAVVYAPKKFTVTSAYTWNGTLTYSPTTLTNVPHNGVLEITVNNLINNQTNEDEALFYCAYILKDENNPGSERIANTGWVFSQEGSTQTVLRLPVGKCTVDNTYNVHIFAGRFAADMLEAATTIPIKITTDDANIGFIFTTNLTYDQKEGAYTVPAYKDFGFFLYKEGANRYELYCNNQKDDEWNTESVSEGYYELAPGYAWLQAYAYVYDEASGKDIPYESEGILVKATAEGVSGIYANVPTVYTVDPQNQNAEPLRFTVTGLSAAEGEYWGFRLRKWDDGHEIWYAGMDHGDQIQPDETNGNIQTFTVENSAQLQAGQIYLLELEAHVVGRRTFRESHTILIRDTQTTQSITLTVNGQPHSCADDVGKPANVVIDAPGAKALALFDGERWNYLDDYDGSGYYEREGRFEENPCGYVAKACYEEPASYNNNPEQAPWTVYSNVVQVIGYVNGQTMRPTVTLEGIDNDNKIARGNTLTVVISNPANLPTNTTYNASRFNVTIENEKGERVSNNMFTENVSVPVRVGMSTGWYHPGTRYKAVVDAQEIGKEWVRAESGWFTVTDDDNYGSSDPTIDLVAEKDNKNVYHVKQGEHAQILGTAPNASRVDVFAHNTDDGEEDEYDIRVGDMEYRDTDPNPDRTEFVFNGMDNAFNRLDAGEYELYAVATYTSGEEQGWTTKNSNRLKVTVEMLDDDPQNCLERPVISLLNNNALLTPYDANTGASDAANFLSFSVTNLSQANANYWEVEVKDDTGNTIFHRTSNGWTDFDTHNVARFAVNKILMTTGASYQIFAKVSGIGYRQQEDHAYVTVATRNTSSRVTVNASTRNLKIGESFDIILSIYDDVTAIMLDKGDGRWEPYAVKYKELLMDQFGYATGTGHTLEHRYDDVGTRAIKVRYSTDKNVPWEQAGYNGGTPDLSNFSWNDVDWADGIVSSVTVNVTSDGALPEPECEISSTKDLVQGDILTVTIKNDPSGNAYKDVEFQYYAEIQKPIPDQGGWRWEKVNDNAHFDWLESNRKILIPTYGLEEGKYRILIGINAEGYQDGNKHFAIQIGKNENLSDFEFAVSNNAPSANEEIALILYAKGHWNTGVNITRTDDSMWRDERTGMKELSIWTWSAPEEGEYTLTPYYLSPYIDPDTQKPDYEKPPVQNTGTPVTVTVTANGDLNEPEIMVNDFVTEGNEVTVHIKATTGTIPATDGTETSEQTTVYAESVKLRLMQQQYYGGPEEERDSIWIELDEKGEGSGTFTEDWFHMGAIYEIDAVSSKKGWNSGYARKKVTVISGNIDPRKQVTLTVNNSTDTPRTFLAGEQFQVQLSAPGATAIRILKDNKWEIFSGESINYFNTWAFGGGNRKIVALASYDNFDPMNVDFDYDLSWTGQSNVIELKITSNGSLGVPTYTVNGLDENNHITRGGILTVIPGEDPEGTPEEGFWYSVDVERKMFMDQNDPESAWWQQDNSMHWEWNGPEDRTISVSTIVMDPGEYRLTVGINALGWDGNEAKTQTIFAVDDTQEEFLTDIPASLPVHSERQYHALISGAQTIDIELQQEKKDKAGTYVQCMPRNGLRIDDWNGIATFGLDVPDIGNYKAVFYVTYLDESNTVLYKQYEVEFTATAIDVLPAPHITMNGLWTSGNLQFTVQTEDNVRVNVNIGNMFFQDQLVFDLSANQFNNDQDYYIQVNQIREGYTGVNATFRVRRTTKYKTLTLPASLTVIEAEAFAGVGAELIIIPDGVTKIEAGTFANCGWLQAIVIPDSVTSIDPNAFTDETGNILYGIVVYGTEESKAEEFAESMAGNNWTFIRLARSNQ